MRVISTLSLKPAPGSSSPEAAAHERYRVGLHAVADLAGSSGPRAAVSSAARPSSWRTVVASSFVMRQRVDRPVCSVPLRRVPGRHALAGVGPAATAARAWSRSRSWPFRPPFWWRSPPGRSGSPCRTGSLRWVSRTLPDDQSAGSVVGPPVALAPPYHGGFELRLCDAGKALGSTLSLQVGWFFFLLHPSLEGP
jgi:hypothetical protein